MKKYLKILSIFLAAVLPLSAETLVLTVEQAVELAQSSNFNLKIQESHVAGSIRAKKDAWNVFIPDISTSFTLNRSNTFQTASSTKSEIDPWTIIGGLSTQLVLSPAISNGINQLDFNYLNAMMNLKSMELNTELNIKKNFYGILLLNEQVEVLKKNILTMESRLNNMEEMYKNGYITRLDLLKTEASLSSMGPVLSSLQNNYELMLMKFSMELGLELSQNIILHGAVEASPETWNADDLVEKYLPGRLDIQQLLLNRKMLENAKSATFNQARLPSLILSWSYSPYQADPFNSDSWKNDLLSGDNGAFSITVSMPIDGWLPHSGIDNKLKEAQDEIDRLDYQRELAFRGAEMEIRSLVMNLNTSRENLDVLEESILINKESLTMSKESYNNGRITLLDLETVENDLLQAENDLLQEKYTYISTLLDLETSVNQQL